MSAASQGILSSVLYVEHQIVRTALAADDTAASASRCAPLQVLLVRGNKSSMGWSFPRGKVNEGETEAECAIREVRSTP